jgi:uroporphyrinogen-III decarboxylase
MPKVSQKSPQEIYQERLKRVNDCLAMKVPDRVPLEIAFGYFPARYYPGITCETAYYDYDKWLAASKKVVTDFGADWSSVQNYFPGQVLELIDPKSLAWPGHGTSALHSHQAIEGEFMKGDEYIGFLGDHTDFMLRSYLPRISGAMAPFSKMPTLANAMGGYMGALSIAMGFSDPDIARSIETLQKAGGIMRQEGPRMGGIIREFEKLGFPNFVTGMAIAPFDAISDNLRGMRGTMLDMYRQEDEILETCGMVLKSTLARIPQATPGKINAVGIPTHRGSEGFMSMKQFKKLYWPGLRGLIEGLIAKGQTPLVFFEGDYTSRLESLLECPKGKVFAHMDTTDMFRAKEVLNGHMCLSGNVPCSILQTGTPDDVKAHVKKLIDIVGKDGAYIMSTRSPVDDALAENLKALIDFTKEYGQYR